MKRIIFVAIIIVFNMLTNAHADIVAQLTGGEENEEEDAKYVSKLVVFPNSDQYGAHIYYTKVNNKNYTGIEKDDKWRNIRVREIDSENTDFEAKMYNKEFVKAGDMYLAYDYSSIGNPSCFFLAEPLLIYDSELNLIKEEWFDGKVCVNDVGYHDGEYYCTYYEPWLIRETDGTHERMLNEVILDIRQIKSQYGDDVAGYYRRLVTVKSTDLENWTVVATANHPDDQLDKAFINFDAIPRKNNQCTILDKKISIIWDSAFSNVIYEIDEDKRIVRQFGEWFIYAKKDAGISVVSDDTRFHFSPDGVYSVRVILNYDSEEKRYFEAADKFDAYNADVYLIETDNEIVMRSDYHFGAIRIPKEEFYSEMEKLKTAPYVRLNGTFLGFEKAPVIKEGRTLVPMRFLFEQMGADVSWDDATQTATATFNDKTVKIRVNSTTATVNGEPKTLDVPAELMEDKTMIPLRFVSENLGFNVSWNDASRIADITG